MRSALSLWVRVYVLIFVVVQVVGVVALVVWLVVNARSGQAVVTALGTYFFLIVPAGFGVTLVVSLPVSVVWLGVAWVLGWRIAAPAVTEEAARRCGGCGYDVTGSDLGVCPECGISLVDAEAEGGAVR